MLRWGDGVVLCCRGVPGEVGTEHVVFESDEVMDTSLVPQPGWFG